MSDFVVGGLRRDQPRLVVHAIDPFGMALSGAKMAVEQSHEKVAGLDTDTAGHGVLEGLAVGNGRLRVEMPGFRSVEGSCATPTGLRHGNHRTEEVGSLANTSPVPTRQHQP